MTGEGLGDEPAELLEGAAEGFGDSTLSILTSTLSPTLWVTLAEMWGSDGYELG